MLRQYFKTSLNEEGFTLTEILVALTVLLLTLTALVPMFYVSFRGIALARTHTIATQIANEKMETIRNMSYARIGTTTGWPQGEIPASEEISYGATIFTVKTSISYVDDAYDGRAFGTPETDLYPYDYKRVKISVSWNNIPCSKPVTLVSNVSPEGPETATNTGSIAVSVLDANGEGVPEAEVHIENSDLNISIDEVANQEGKLLIPSLPPDESGYYVSATKFGYSEDYTSAITVENPNPTKPNLSVLVTQVSEVTLTIDKLSTLNLEVRYEDSYGNSGVVADADFILTGEKFVGEDPNIPKYSEAFKANSDGNITVSNLEWDSYNIALTSSTGELYELVEEANPALPFSLSPDTLLTVTVTLRPRSLLVTVKDGVSGALLSDASVRARNEGLDYDETLATAENGQVLFASLYRGSYDIEVTKSGYSSFLDTAVVESENSLEVLLFP